MVQALFRYPLLRRQLVEGSSVGRLVGDTGIEARHNNSTLSLKLGKCLCTTETLDLGNNYSLGHTWNTLHLQQQHREISENSTEYRVFKKILKFP